MVLPETFMSVDEQVIPFKGEMLFIKKTPKKWRYKIWTRAGISGYIYDFEVWSKIKRTSARTYTSGRLTNSLGPEEH